MGNERNNNLLAMGAILIAVVSLLVAFGPAIIKDTLNGSSSKNKSYSDDTLIKCEEAQENAAIYATNVLKTADSYYEKVFTENQKLESLNKSQKKKIDSLTQLLSNNRGKLGDVLEKLSNCN